MKLFVRGPSQAARLVLAVILSSLLMFFDARDHFLAPVKSSLYSLLYPIQVSLNVPIQWIEQASEAVFTREELQSQIANLKAQQFFLKAQLQKFSALEKENAELRALLKSTTAHHERLQVAELISVNQEPFVQEYLVNLGKKAGAYVTQPVLAANGLVGQVVEVMPLASRILLITDPRSAIPVEDSRTGIRAILVGTGKTDELKLINIPPTTPINPGDILVTSGLGGRFPTGYPVGTVLQVTRTSDAEFETIIVKPMVDVNRLRLMLMVWNTSDNKL